MSRIQREGGKTADKPSPLAEREEYIDITLGIKHIGLTPEKEMTIPNIEPGTAGKPLPIWNADTKRYEKHDLSEYMKCFVAKITQFDTGIPALVGQPLANNLTGTPVFTRSAAGHYQLALTGELKLGKTVVKIAFDGDIDETVSITVDPYTVDPYTVDGFTFQTFDLTGFVDSVLNNALLEIYIYP